MNHRLVYGHIRSAWLVYTGCHWVYVQRLNPAGNGRGRDDMKIRLLITCLALVLLAGGGCVEPKVQTQSDASADFSAFHTFAFVRPPDRTQDRMVADQQLRNRIEGMVAQQLTTKGLRQVGLEERPDLLVDLRVGVKEKQQTERTGMVSGGTSTGNYGWRTGYYGGGTTTFEYQEGTLFVDLVESTKKELVWKATIAGTLAESADKNMEMASAGIAKAFEDYPPPAKKR
jgi:hypothetical protein